MHSRRIGPEYLIAEGVEAKDVPALRDECRIQWPFGRPGRGLVGATARQCGEGEQQDICVAPARPHLIVIRHDCFWTPGVATARTTSLPCMVGWKAQVYRYTPAR